jgi:transcriptional regulator with XRE-family HTH domain
VIACRQKITNVNTLKERLQYARELRGLSQGELARLAKCSQSTIGNIESGERDSLRNLVVVARVLRVSADWLYDGHGPKPTKPDEAYKSQSSDALINAEEPGVAYIAKRPDPLQEQLLMLFSLLDDEGKKHWLADLAGYVRGSRPHALGSALGVAAK